MSLVRPWLLGTDNGFYYVLLLAAVLHGGGDHAHPAQPDGSTTGGAGRLADRTRDPGAATNVIRVLIFCISAALASMAGALDRDAVPLQPWGATYDPFESLVLVALVVSPRSGRTVVRSDGRPRFRRLPGYVTVSNITTYLEIALRGAGRGRGLRQPDRHGAAARVVRDVLDRLGGRRPAHEVTGRCASPGRKPPRPTTGRRVAAASGKRLAGHGRPSAGGLEVRGLSVRYGGVAAVQDVSLSAPRGRVTGLVGPNGAGKTTTLQRLLGAGEAEPRPGGPPRPGCSPWGRPAGPGSGWAGPSSGPSSSSRSPCGRTWHWGGRPRWPEPTRYPVGRYPPNRRTVRRAVDEALRSPASGRCPTSRPGSCRPASAGWSSWPGCSPGPSTCCSSTSRRRVSTVRRPAASARS